MKKITTTSLKIIPFILLSCLVSCDKNDVEVTPIDKKDSTLLIKSIKASVLGEDITEFYDYDSVNRKITLTWNDPNGQFPQKSAEVFSYNDKGLISKINITQGSSTTPQPEDLAEVIFVYDDASILKSISFKLRNGNTDMKNYSKTITGNGYRLAWTETDENLGNGAIQIPCTADFDNTGKLLKHNLVYNNSGHVTSTTDSVLYDGSGNIAKVYRKHYDSNTGNTDVIVLAEFLSRDTRGDNLYNQRKALLNGVENIPFDQTENGFSDAFGILSLFPSGIETKQHVRHPFIAAKFYNFTTDLMEPFNSNLQIDSIGRLKKMQAAFVDTEVFPNEYSITYFK